MKYNPSNIRFVYFILKHIKTHENKAKKEAAKKYEKNGKEVLSVKDIVKKEITEVAFKEEKSEPIPDVHLASLLQIEPVASQETVFALHCTEQVQKQYINEVYQPYHYQNSNSMYANNYFQQNARYYHSISDQMQNRQFFPSAVDHNSSTTSFMPSSHPVPQQSFVNGFYSNPLQSDYQIKSASDTYASSININTSNVMINNGHNY